MKYLLCIVLLCLCTPVHAQTVAEDIKAGQKLLDEDRELFRALAVLAKEEKK